MFCHLSKEIGTMKAAFVALWALVSLSTLAEMFVAIAILLAIEEVKTHRRTGPQFADLFNPYILVEYGVHALTTGVTIYLGEFWLAIINIALVSFHIRKYLTKPKDVNGVFDPSKLQTKAALNKVVLEGAAKFGIHFVCFLAYGFRCLMLFVGSA
eukprot:m.74555 g.74555  ORF g.74555 m.74555 type:complete len:155 (+) comp12401_c0_seq2:78-542(+)